MGLQSHAYQVLNDELGIEPGTHAAFVESNLMVVEAQTQEDAEMIMFALEGDFNPKITTHDKAAAGWIAIQFLPMAYWTQGS